MERPRQWTAATSDNKRKRTRFVPGRILESNSSDEERRGSDSVVQTHDPSDYAGRRHIRRLSGFSLPWSGVGDTGADYLFHLIMENTTLRDRIFARLLTYESL